jgi:hypothetical protein
MGLEHGWINLKKKETKENRRDVKAGLSFGLPHPQRRLERRGTHPDSITLNRKDGRRFSAAFQECRNPDPVDAPPIRPFPEWP